MRTQNATLEDKKPTLSFREGGKTSVSLAFFVGTVILGAGIVLGRSRIYILFIPAVAFIMTLLWRRLDRPWINLASIAAATPIAVARYKLNGNLIFALFYTVLNPRCFFRLPGWIYLPSILVLFGLITSSINWTSEGVTSGFMRQIMFAFNLFFGPFLLLPAVYQRMKSGNNHEANLKTLLFCLILPSTILLLSAKLFGNIANLWEASRHTKSLVEGFYMYRLGNAYINFLRTEIGFILAALICASVAIVSCPIKTGIKTVASGCLLVNIFLLLSTASFGSIAACFMGLAAIFLVQMQKINLGKVILSVFVLCFTLVITYALAPDSTKDYLEKRFEHRVVNKDTDRLTLWAYGVDAILKHPEGVGLTLKGSTGAFIHNDYIVYMVSYGVIGGLCYFLLVISVIVSFLRLRKKISRDPAALAVYLAGLGVIVALAFNSITDHSNENRWYFNVIWSIIWYCYFCSLSVQNRSFAKIDPTGESIENTGRDQSLPDTGETVHKPVRQRTGRVFTGTLPRHLRRDSID